MSKSVLIIGGTGFFGTTLREVLGNDSNLDVSYSSTNGDANNPHHLAIDLLQPETLKEIHTFDIVINLSGQMESPIELNTIGMQHLLDALQGSDTFFIQMSSTMVYGPTSTAIESAKLNPQSPYAAAKVEAEQLVQAALPEDRLLIIRLCNLYGPGQKKGLIWFLLDKITSGSDIVIENNNGELHRHFIHVEDASRILQDLIAAHATGIINVATEQSHSIKELIALGEKILDRAIPATFGEATPTDTIDQIDTTELKNHVSVAFEHSIEKYLREQLS